MIILLKTVFGFLFLFMTYMVVVTSLESNLFKELPALITIPWMKATLYDFYGLVALIYVWVLYKERAVAMKILWLILFVGLGSIATSLYLLIQLFRLKPGESVEQLLVKRNG